MTNSGRKIGSRKRNPGGVEKSGNRHDETYFTCAGLSIGIF